MIHVSLWRHSNHFGLNRGPGLKLTRYPASTMRGLLIERPKPWGLTNDWDEFGKKLKVSVAVLSKFNPTPHEQAQTRP